jgi:Ser/Thr protein kinase RdoA (MazF antagonist)
MVSRAILNEILPHYNLSSEDLTIETIGSGHIHSTYKLSGRKNFILQQVNKNVFRKPEVIASNLRVASQYLRNEHPDYLFLAPIETNKGEQMVYASDGFPWRLFPYLDNTYTIDRVETSKQAFSAAAEFAKLARYLDDVNINLFSPTIDRFHDLNWRYEQFETSLATGVKERISQTSDVISHAKKFAYLVEEYDELIESGVLKPRITHNDTKINNVLFGSTSGEAVCAIDLDTLMTGYFIYDIGDMIRTFVCPVDEEEKDLTRIAVRSDIYEAIIQGYLSEMGRVLDDKEKETIPFAGMMMTYIMALRMLTDHLNGNVYYKIKYPGQNLVRARNQFRLLELLEKYRPA